MAEGEAQCGREGCALPPEEHVHMSVTPYEPPHLRDLVESISYKPGWSFSLELFREDGEDPYRVWHVGDHAAIRKKAGED